MSEVISVLSGKGGTGKTFTASNLSLAFQQLGEQAVCIDTDLDSANLAMQLGHRPRDYTLEDVLDDEVNELKAINIHDSGLMFVPASLHLSDEEISEDRLKSIVDNLSGFADRIVIDAPPGFGGGFQETLGVSDRILVVTNPEFQALNDAKKIVEEAEKHGKEVEGLILNKAEDMLGEVAQEEVEELMDSDVLLKIPYRKEVRRSIYKNKPVTLDRHSEVGHRFKELAADLSGKEFRTPWYSGAVRLLRKLTRV